MADSSAAAAAHHAQNTQTIVEAAAATKPTPSALNPLLARGKLKKPGKASSGKGKSKAKLVKDVTKARQDELNVVSSGGPDPAEEGEVLDLADQLLEQLGGHLDDDSAPPSTAPASTSQPATPSNALSPTPSHGSGHSTRERFNGFKEDLKDAFMPNRNSDASGDRKPNRQHARKVRPLSLLLPLGRHRIEPELTLSPRPLLQLRKADHFEQQRRDAEAEVVAENDRSVEMEKQAIETQCRKLKVMIKEIEPDGHWCVLFSRPRPCSLAAS